MTQKPLSKSSSAYGLRTLNHSPNQAKGLLIDKAIDKPFLSYKPFGIPSVIGSIKQYYLITHFIIFCISHMMKMSGGGTMRNKKFIAQGRYTDVVDDVLCKFVSAKKKSIKNT